MRLDIIRYELRSEYEYWMAFSFFSFAAVSPVAAQTEKNSPNGEYVCHRV